LATFDEGRDETMNGPRSAEEKLEAVVRGARAILAKRTFLETARAIFDRCREMTGAIAGYVALLSEDGQENEVLFLEAGGMPCSVDPELPMPIRGLRATAYETHEAVYHNGFMNSQWAHYMPEGHVMMKNVMFAPLNIESKTVGIMGLANKPSDFTDEDAHIASVFGELAAIALANSRYLDLLNERTASLEQALSEVKTLRGLLPICSLCKRIRDDSGHWDHVEVYVRDHTDADFSHTYCPECYRQALGEIERVAPADPEQ